MPPDEYHSNVTNSVYTNTVAQLSLRLPEYAGKLINVSVPSTWSEIADKLAILYSDAHKYHPEFEGYTIGKSMDMFALLRKSSIKERGQNNTSFLSLPTHTCYLQVISFPNSGP